MGELEPASGDSVMPIGVGWQVHFEHEFMRDGWRMHLWRRVGNEVEVASGTLTVTRMESGVEPVTSGLYLPGDAYQAIVSAIDPPAHAAEVRRIEEALAVERARVERLIDHALTAQPNGSTEPTT